MKSRVWIVLILCVDIVVMTVAALIVWDRVQRIRTGAGIPWPPVLQVHIDRWMKNPPSSRLGEGQSNGEVPAMSGSQGENVPAAPSDPLSIPSTVGVSSPSVAAPTLSTSPLVRRIMFTYHHAKATRVDIVGSFDEGKPQPFTKGKNNQWSVTVVLTPGDYTYNFVVNGKTIIRDPNNPLTAPEGRSFIHVEPSR